MRKLLLTALCVLASGLAWAETPMVIPAPPLSQNTITNLPALNKAAVNGSITNGSYSLFGSFAQLSGSLSGTNNFAANYEQITGDILAYTGNNYVSTFHIDHNFGGPGMTGSRAGLDVSMIMQGKTSNAGNASQYYVGIANYVQCGYNDNGTAGFANAAGSCVAFNPIASLTGSATYWYTLNSEEIDTIMSAGTSAAHVFGTLNVKSGSAQGTYDDAALAFAAGSGSPAWLNLIQIGKTDGSSPTNSSSNLLTCIENAASPTPCPINNGIDLRNFNIHGNAFASPGFAIDGSGNVAAATISTPTIKGPTAGISSVTNISGPGTYTSIPSVSIAAPPAGGVQALGFVSAMGMGQWTQISGGSGYQVGDVLSLPGGTYTTAAQVIVTSVSSSAPVGAITATSGYNGGAYSVLPVANINATNGHGSGAVFSLSFYVETISISTQGSGYLSAPSVSIGGGAGAGTGVLSTTQPLAINSTAGVLASGPFSVPNLVSNGSVPTLSGSCSAGTQVGGMTAGSFKLSAACSGGTIILTFGNTAANGWACDAHDLTTPADALNQTAYSANAVTFTGSMAASDLVAFKCMGF